MITATFANPTPNTIVRYKQGEVCEVKINLEVTQRESEKLFDPIGTGCAFNFSIQPQLDGGKQTLYPCPINGLTISSSTDMKNGKDEKVELTCKIVIVSKKSSPLYRKHLSPAPKGIGWMTCTSCDNAWSASWKCQIV